jgi:transposase
VETFIRIGVDLAKNYFQVHALASESSPAVKRKLTRSKMHRFFSQIEPMLYRHGSLRLGALLGTRTQGDGA